MGILSLYQGRVGTGLPGRVHREIRGTRVATALTSWKKSGVPGGILFTPCICNSHSSYNYTVTDNPVVGRLCDRAAMGL